MLITNSYRAEMDSENFLTTAPERQKTWNYINGNFRHGIDESVPHIHELVLMNDESDLRSWITQNP